MRPLFRCLLSLVQFMALSAACLYFGYRESTQPALSVAFSATGGVLGFCAVVLARVSYDIWQEGQ